MIEQKDEQIERRAAEIWAAEQNRKNIARVVTPDDWPRYGGHNHYRALAKAELEAESIPVYATAKGETEVFERGGEE